MKYEDNFYGTPPRAHLADVGYGCVDHDFGSIHKAERPEELPKTA